MENLVIRELEKADMAAFLDYAADWTRDVSPFKIDEAKIYATISEDNFEDFQTEIEQEKTLPKNPDYSTATKYFAFINGKIAGVISCRWQIEKGILLEWGGHIGYGVAPSFRGHHLAEQMVKFALPEYKKRGILRVMISADEDNIASRKTIERNGGVLENIVSIDDSKVCRYWIDLENEEH
ncbi:GNAT family N-acetyltransferase [Lactococcus kimchii]|uniref:GNAT family N-acetyltransferase n=1 Tax=Lactococcus sp. S-13 TaxID=2507158 RepID=UPI001022EA41|nr:GNAT family N-acetyltransferase [Lactococcus sp. S-13]RZI48829.1 GNAT family N-acetyltransferase [Lactococcus sp. S-13]